MKIPASPLLSSLACLALGSSALAQLSWTEQHPTHSPAARFGHAMAFDYGSYDSILFGGFDGSQTFGDTWAWRDGDWEQLLFTGPAARLGHALQRLDFEQHEILLFGGQDVSGTLLGDTWIMGPTGWQSLATPVAPSARRGHAIAVDEWSNRRVVLFGGRTELGLSDETWVFDGAAWSEVLTAHRPPGREEHALLQDRESRNYLLQGGRAGAQVFDDQWEFDGSDWHLSPDSGPARSGHGLLFVQDPRRRALSFGGEGRAALGLTLERTVEGQWIEHTAVSNPPARDEFALFENWDFPRGWSAWLFGGRDESGAALGDTWQLDFVVEAATSEVLPGCGAGPWGPNAGPFVSFFGPPIIGNTLSVFVLTPTPVSSMLAVMGPQAMNAPFVGGLGGNSSASCGLRIRATQRFPVAVDSGSMIGLTGGEFQVPIPFDLGLQGSEWLLQVVVDDHFTASGRAASSVLRLRFAE